MYELREKLSSKGWPVHTQSGRVSAKWKKAHPAANRAALKKFGSKKAKEVAKLVKKIPEGELLGSHTKSGKILISKRVPKKLRHVVAYHEVVEHRRMVS